MQIIEQVFVVNNLLPKDGAPVLSANIERAGKVLQKLCQIGLINNQSIVNACYEKLNIRESFDPQVNYFEF